jgi:hypothetical protein
MEPVLSLVTNPDSLGNPDPNSVTNPYSVTKSDTLINLGPIAMQITGKPGSGYKSGSRIKLDLDIIGF